MGKKIVFTFLIALFLLSPVLIMAAGEDCTAGTGTSGLCNPLNSKTAGPQADFFTLIRGLMSRFGNFFTLTTIVMLVFSGFIMVISQGNSEQLTVAKDSFKWSLLGFALAMLSYVIVVAMVKYLGFEELPEEGTTVGNVVNPYGQGKTMFDLIIRMLTDFLSIAGIIAVFMLVFNGVRYLTAGGNEEQTTGARQGILWALVGTIVIVSAYALTQALIKLFS